MRQKRKAGLSVSIGRILVFAVILAAVLVGMQQAGWIVLNGKLGAIVETMMFWKSGESATAANRPAAGAKPGSTAPAKEAAVSSAPPSPQTSEAASSAPSSQPTATPQPSPSPLPSPSSPAKQGEQSLVQVQSLTPIGDNERAWWEQAAELKLDPGKLLSLNDWVRETVKNKKLEAKEAELSHLAGMLYEGALRAGLEVGERYIHTDLPNYAAAGFDVHFEPDRKNLTLYNPYDFAFKLEVAYNGQLPVLSLVGSPSAKWSAVSLDVQKETVSPDKLMLVDFSLAGGKVAEVKREDGKDGLLVKVYKKGKENEPKTLLAKDYYAPHPVVAARAPTAEEMKAAAR